MNTNIPLPVHLESTLALAHSRRTCRLSSFFSVQSAVTCSKHSSILLSFLSVIFLFSSVAAAQQQQQRMPSSTPALLVRGSTNVFSGPARVLPVTSTTLAKIASYNELNAANNNSTHSEQVLPVESPCIARLVLIITVCSLMTGVTIIGNLVVILAVCLVRKLQTASNILIVSLAVSDVFVGLFIMPLAMGKNQSEAFSVQCVGKPVVSLALVLEISNGNWILGSIMCDIWTSTDVLLCTASILNFLVISIDRYCIINHPFKYAPMRKVKLLSLMIAAVWILSALVSLPPILGWGRTYRYMLPECLA